MKRKNLLILASLPAFIILSSLFFAPCKSKTKCVDNGDCGYMEACINEECTPVECLSSDDCLIEQFCDKRNYVCKDGCIKDSDCLAGYVCKDRKCIEYGCRDTQLDCEYGEFCDTSSGECYEAKGPYCKECNPYSPNPCQGENNFCLQWEDGKFYCGVDCSQGQECPRGYECGEIVNIFGEVLGYNCFADCSNLPN